MKKALKIVGSIIGIFITAIIVLLVIDISNDDEQAEQAKKVSITGANFTDKDLLKAVKKKDEDVSKVHIDKDLVTVTFKEDLNFWDESMMFVQGAKKSATLFKELFKRDDVSKVKVILPTTFADQKGNETIEDAITITLDKATSDEIDYKNFISLLGTHPAYMYNNATEYYIHPSIFKLVKPEYFNELDGSFRKDQS